MNWQHELAQGMTACLPMDELYQYVTDDSGGVFYERAALMPLEVSSTHGIVYVDYGTEKGADMGWVFDLVSLDPANPSSRIALVDENGGPPPIYQTNEITWEMWYKIDGSISLRYRTFIFMSSFGEASPPFTGYGYCLRGPQPFASNTFVWQVTTVENGFVNLAFDVPETGWFHLVGLYDGSYLKIYLNGNLLASTAQFGQIDYTDCAGLYISNGGDVVAQEAKGTLALYRQWNRALEESEIRQLMDEPFSMFWYPAGRMTFYQPPKPVLENIFLMLQPSNC